MKVCVDLTQISQMLAFFLNQNNETWVLLFRYVSSKYLTDISYWIVILCLQWSPVQMHHPTQIFLGSLPLPLLCNNWNICKVNNLVQLCYLTHDIYIITSGFPEHQGWWGFVSWWKANNELNPYNGNWRKLIRLQSKQNWNDDEWLSAIIKFKWVQSHLH